MQIQFKTHNNFINDLLTGKHNFDGDTFRVSLSNDVDKAGTNDVNVKAAVSGGTVSLGDVVLQNATPTFRYIVVHNARSGRVVGSLDYGSSQQLRAGDKMNIVFGEILVG